MSLTLAGMAIAFPSEVWGEVLVELQRHDPFVAVDQAYALFLGLADGEVARAFPRPRRVALEILAELDGNRGTFPGLPFDDALKELDFDFATHPRLKAALQYVSSGAVKEVSRLQRYPEIAIAIAKTPKQNASVELEPPIMVELARRGLRVVAVSPRCCDAPGAKSALTAPDAPLARDRRAFLMQYVEGYHVFPGNGVDPDPAKIPTRSAVFRRAARLGIMESPSQLQTLIDDLAALVEYCRQCTGCLVDLQGMIEKGSGHFYLCDPSCRALDSGLKQEPALQRVASLVQALREAQTRLTSSASDVVAQDAADGAEACVQLAG